jgi:Tol biopolymer transport system component
MLIYTATDSKTATGDIWSYSLETEASTPLVNTPKDERYGTVSPDGQWLAYVSNDSDTYEVNVRALHGGVRRQISTGGGSQPQWRRDGRELLYMAADRSIVAVPFQSGPDGFIPGPHRSVVQTRTKSLEIQGTARTYAITSDGQRFLVANATEEAKAASIVVVRNWRTALER